MPKHLRHRSQGLPDRKFPQKRLDPVKENITRIAVTVVSSFSFEGGLSNGISNNVWIYIRVVGVLDDGSSEASQWDLPDAPVLGQLDDLARIINEHRISSVYIALPLSRIAAIKDIYDKVAEQRVNIFWVPDVTTFNPLNFSVRELSGVPILALSETPLLGSSKLLKEIEDKVLASLALLICSPVMLLIALLIKHDSSGPVFFRQRRNGWYGEVINVWKFRSMYLTNSTGDFVEQASRHDPRVTPIGRILRATSLDELPQLFNVLGRHVFGWASPSRGPAQRLLLEAYSNVYAASPH